LRVTHCWERLGDFGIRKRYAIWIIRLELEIGDRGKLVF
jgi:hypothetical protein